MILRSLLSVATISAVLALTQPVVAAPGVAKGGVNLRTGPGTNYARIATIPAGAPVDVLRCGRWCEVIYAGRRGWASASYIARGAVRSRGYFALPDQSLCHGPEAWSIPWCETPIERSARDFANSTRDFQMRQGGKR
jgi:uncharacterized protein YraI